MPQEAPTTKPGHIVIKVLASAISTEDQNATRNLSAVPGSDFVGEVFDIGPDVDHWPLGTRVMVDPIVVCHNCRWCQRKQYQHCNKIKTIGHDCDGGHATFVTVAVENCHVIPDNLDTIEVTGLSLPGTMVYRALQRPGLLKPDDVVLVLEATSSIGLIAIQMAKLAGARVIALTHLAQNESELKQLGAHRTVIHNPIHPGWAAKILSSTGQRGVDLIIDSVGSLTWSDCIQALAFSGTLLTCGNSAATLNATEVLALNNKELTLRGFGRPRHGDLAKILALASLSGLRIPIAHLIPFSNYTDGYELLSQQAAFGRIVLDHQPRKSE